MSKTVTSQDKIEERGEQILAYQLDVNHFLHQPNGTKDKIADIDGRIRLRDGSNKKGKYLPKYLDYQLKSKEHVKDNKFSFDVEDINYQITVNTHTITIVVDVTREKIFWYYFRENIDSLNIDPSQKSKTIDLTDFEFDADPTKLKEKWNKIASSGIPPEKPSPKEMQSDLDKSLASVTSESQTATGADINSEYQSELDEARNLIESGKPATALILLENLKERVWEGADKKVRFRILTNIGASKLSLEDEAGASEFFLKALEISPEEEKALANAALAYLITGKRREAAEFARKALEKNGLNPQAISVFLQASTSKQRESYLKKNKSNLQDSPEAYFSLGFIEQKLGNYDDSVFYLRKALELNEKDSLEIPGLLAGVLIEKNIQKAKKQEFEGVKKKINEEISEAISLLDDVWKKVSGTELEKGKVDWLVNRSFAKRILGNHEEAYADAKRAYEIDPIKFKVVRNLAVLAFEMEKLEEASRLLSEFKESKEFPEAAYLLAIIKREQGDYEQSISLLKSELKRENISPEHAEDGEALLVETYLMADKKEDAIKFLDSQLDHDTNNIRLRALKAKLLQQKGDKEAAIDEVKKAAKLIDSNTPYSDRFVIADRFYQLQQFKSAQGMYEELLDKSIYTKLLYRLLHCYYETNSYTKALALAQQITKKHGDIEDVLKVQAAILDEQGNSNALMETYRKILSINPDDATTKIQIAFLLLRQGKEQELDDFLDEIEIDLSNLSLTGRYRYAYLLSLRKRQKQFLDSIYETRRKFYEESQAHLDYIRLFFSRTHNDEQRELLDFNEIQDGATVFYKFPDGKTEHYTIDNRDDAVKLLKEIRPSEDLAKKLMGKRVGDKVELTDGVQIEIVEIKSKYVHALHESLALHQSIFVNTPELQSFRLGESKSESELPEGFEKIREQIAEQYEQIKKVENLYKKRQITIHGFARLIGKGEIETWGGMVADKRIGVNYSQGTLQERIDALNQLKKDSKLVIDLIGLLTIHALDVKDILHEVYGSFGIAQSTLDLITHQINQLEPIQEKGYLSLAQNDSSQLTRHEVTSDSIKRNIKFLKDLLDWTLSKCEVLPVEDFDDLDKKRKEEMEEILGVSFLDTALIARSENRLLFSDDFTFRIVARNEFGVNGIWTQALFLNLFDNGHIPLDQYDDLVTKLLSLNYIYTSIKGSTLLHALKKAEWKIDEPFITALESIEPSKSDIVSAAAVASDFLYEYFSRNVIIGETKLIIFKLLDSLGKERTVSQVLRQFRKELMEKFKMMPTDFDYILQCIEEWSKEKVL